MQPMLEAMAEWMGYPLNYAFDGAPPPPRAGAAHATIHPYGPFPCGDGKTVMLGLQNEREWLQFCDKALLQPALARDERFAGNAQRTAHREALRTLIVQAFTALSSAQQHHAIKAQPHCQLLHPRRHQRRAPARRRAAGRHGGRP